MFFCIREIAICRHHHLGPNEHALSQLQLTHIGFKNDTLLMMSPPRVHFLLKHLCLAQRRTRPHPEICAPFTRIVR